MDDRMDRASGRVSEYDYDSRPMPERPSGVDTGFDHLTNNIVRLDEAIERLLKRIEPITRPTSSPTDVDGKRDPDMSAVAISLFDKGDWLRRIAQKVEYTIERIDI